MARGGRSPAAQKKLAKRVEVLLEAHDLAALERGVSEEVAAVLWYAVAHAGGWAGDLAGLGGALPGGPLAGGRAATLAGHLARATPEPEVGSVLPCWPKRLDALVWRAYGQNPEAFEARALRLPSWARLGLALVQRRRGKEVPSELAAEVALALATSFARRGPFGWTFAYEDEGREATLTVAGVEELRQLATLVDASTAHGSAWTEALARAVDENRWDSIAPLAPVLEALPLSRLVAHLVSRSCRSDEQRLADRSAVGVWFAQFALSEALSVLTSRADSPDELVAEAVRHASLPADSDARPSRWTVATLLAVVAATRTTGDVEAMATVLERLVSLDVIVGHRVLTEPLVAVARALPADRVLGWAERALRETGAAVVLLGAHFDRALFERALGEGPPPSPQGIGCVGAPALASVLAAIAVPATDPERQARVRHGLVFLLDELLRAGFPPDEDLDLELLIAAFDGRPMERAPYCHSLQLATERLVNAMPLDRRRAILVEARATAPMSVSAMLPSIESDAELDEHLGYAIRQGLVGSWLFRLLGARAVGPLLAHAAFSTQMAWVHDEAKTGLPSNLYAQVAGAFVPGSKWRVIEADFAGALAAMPEVPRARVYLLEPASMAYSAREGSVSRVGGAALGVRKADLPADGDGLRHMLTLDLADVPELAPRYPGAQAIALFCSDDDAEDATWVPIARGASLRPGASTGGTALAVRGFDVPSVVLTEQERDLGPEARAVLDRVLHASGHVFGRPFWIHATPGASEGFLMQVNDALVDHPFPFEALYLFDDGAVIAQTL